MNIPPISKELLESLSALYPDRCPEPTDSERDIWIKVGQVSVIRFLEHKFEEQNENTLETHIDVLVE